MGALVAYRGLGDHVIQVDAGDRVDSVNQRYRIGATSQGCLGAHANIGDIRCEFYNYRLGVVLFAPVGDFFDQVRVLAHRRSHAALRHAVGAAQVELNAICAGGFY